MYTNTYTYFYMLTYKHIQRTPHLNGPVCPCYTHNYLCIYIYTYIHIHSCVYIHTHRMGTLFVASFSPLICICTCLYIYTYTLIYTYRPMWRHAHSYLHSYIHMQTLKMYRLFEAFSPPLISINTYLCIRTHTHTPIHTHTHA